MFVCKDHLKGFLSGRYICSPGTINDTAVISDMTVLSCSIHLQSYTRKEGIPLSVVPQDTFRVHLDVCGSMGSLSVEELLMVSVRGHGMLSQGA